MITTGEAAQRLGVNPATVRRWAMSGRITYHRVGHFRVLDPREVERLRRRRQGKARGGKEVQR